MELCTVDVQQYVQSIWLIRIYCVKTNIFPECRPVLILQAGQGALELLLVLVFQVGQQHVLSAGWVMVQGWAGVTQEVLIFIPESPTQETAHWATSTQPPAAQSRAKDNMGQAKAGRGKVLWEETQWNKTGQNGTGGYDKGTVPGFTVQILNFL